MIGILEFVSCKPVSDNRAQYILALHLTIRTDAHHIHDVVQLRKIGDPYQVLLIIRKIYTLRKFRDTAATIKLTGLQIIKTATMCLSVFIHRQLAAVNDIQTCRMRCHTKDHAVGPLYLLRTEHGIRPFR